jgi:dsDNA-binding SOS-regulon protein
MKYVVVAVLQDEEKVEDFAKWLTSKKEEVMKKLDTKRVMIIAV